MARTIWLTILLFCGGNGAEELFYSDERILPELFANNNTFGISKECQRDYQHMLQQMGDIPSWLTEDGFWAAKSE